MNHDFKKGHKTVVTSIRYAIEMDNGIIRGIETRIKDKAHPTFRVGKYATEKDLACARSRIHAYKNVLRMMGEEV